MTDQKQIITELQDAAAYFRSSFDAMYGTITCEKFRGWTDAIEQVLALLKEQEPRLLTLDEIHDSMTVYLEAGEKFLKIVDDDGVVLAVGGSSCANAKCFITVWNVGIAAMDDEYNVTWRAWSERPTVEQREGTPWLQTNGL